MGRSTRSDPEPVSEEFVEDPGAQLVALSTGLTAVVGNAAWQVVWLLGVMVWWFVVVRRPPGGAGTDGGDGGGGGGGRPIGPTPNLPRGADR